MIAAAVLLAPFAGWVVLAIWLSGSARGLHDRLTRRLRRVNLAAFLTVAIMMTVLVPVGAILTLLVIDAIALVRDLAQSDQVDSVLTALVSNSDTKPSTETDYSDLLVSQGARAWGVARMILTSAVQAIIGVVILIAGIYALLVDGRRWYAWIEDHATVGRRAVRRFAGAFVETGRGLAFGVVGAGVVQAVLATVAYLVLGVPQALPLGFLTLLFSIVPLVGTALVWVPVAAGLALTGRVYEGLGLAIFGIVVIGTVDNLARPYLTKFGKLQLPTFIVLVSMFGGVELFGGWGILFGPLIVRLAKEALEVRREAVAA